MLQPPLDEVLRAPPEAAIPVYAEISADTETPISVFLKLRRGGTGFLLESAEQDGSLGRYSFIGVAPDAVLRAELDCGTLTTQERITAYQGDPLQALRDFAGSAPIHGAGDVPLLAGGLIGAFSYDFARALEKLPAGAAPEPATPAALFARYHTVITFDHLKQRLLIVSLIPPGAQRSEAYHRARARVEQTLATLRRAPSAPPLDLPRHPDSEQDIRDRAIQSPSETEFLAAVSRAREYILAGDAIQVVLSRRLSVPLAGDPFRVYRALRLLSPSPYMFFLEFPGVTLLGSSPEMLLRISGDAAQANPIAGTRRRGRDAAEDVALEADLLADPKERAEHLMLVDLARNDLGRVCRPGSVHVPRFMLPERYSHVMHLVSTVTGRLSPDADALTALASAFPAGTVSGAPKVRAMQIIDELEPIRRGFYAGAVGYIAAGARSLDTCIAIRSLVVRDARAHLQAGAGIVADSDPRRELAETDEKAASLLRALAAAGAVPLATGKRAEGGGRTAEGGGGPVPASSSGLSSALCPLPSPVPAPRPLPSPVTSA